ncbi:MAG: GNAT family N-acetyltransferase [Myxococcota bacterium]
MSGALRARLLGAEDREAVLDYLREASDENLILFDLATRLGNGLRPGEFPPQIYGAFRGDAAGAGGRQAVRLEGVLAIRPSVALSFGLSDEALNIFLPYLLRVPSGLLKSERRVVEPLWDALSHAGREAMIDRIEIAYRLGPKQMMPAQADLPGVARPARIDDLDELVFAARASLWEENRPDPAESDPVGFRRWVQGRLGRARIVSEQGKTVFVAYADVRRDEGWLVQGVYTWPDVRRQGFARRGMDSVIREAFASGASHVQLAVVEGNDRASELYRTLGFEAFAELRTILFH